MVLFLELGGELQLKPAFSGTYLYKYTCTHYIYIYVHFGQMHTHRYALVHKNAHAHTLICLWNHKEYKKHIHHPRGVFFIIP